METPRGSAKDRDQSPSVTFNAEVESLAELARALLAEGDLVGAAQALQHAVAFAPGRADLHYELGNVRQGLNNHEAALACYRKAVELDPEFIPARQNLGYLLMNHGEPEQALEHYECALAKHPTPITHMLAATVLPVIYDSAEDVDYWRARLQQRVRAFAASGQHIETSRSQIPTSFYLAYQGRNDRQIAADLGRIYQGVDLCQRLDNISLNGRNDRRLRIGFLSAYFRDHTVGCLNLGRVQHLSRQRFEVTVLSVGQAHDPMGQAFVRAADRYVDVPCDVEAARQTVADQNLDVLIFTDVGMNSITSTLVYSRMAPVQCATWGHPDTTGSRAIDYYISSELAETPDADSHYTERLVRLPLLGTYYHCPVRKGPPRKRSFFGLDDDLHIYLCPQTLFKLHPDFDGVLAGILAADTQGIVVLLESRVRNWTQRLKRRFARTVPDAQRRVRFLPAQSHDDYLALLETADVIIDPLQFGGGNSSYEALAMGTPVVTLPSQFLRGRMTRALYAKMGFLEASQGSHERSLIAESTEEFVATAVQLGTNTDTRDYVSRRIREQSGLLFEDPREVACLEEFLGSLVRTD
jgi:protein O-GlcNAc transferase